MVKESNLKLGPQIFNISILQIYQTTYKMGHYYVVRLFYSTIV